MDSSLFRVPDRLTDVAPWQGHIPFAFWVISATKPRLLVELGTHKGDSYSAFCQSVSESDLATTCYAVDSWQGDEHAGLYGEEVFQELNAYNQRKYGGFSTLLRMMFEDALSYFNDGSIDLLHIDGYHSYDAVREDFEKWLPKMSDRGVILLHDVAVRERGFGVWKFWADVAERFPSLELPHSNGLGVLAVGSEVPERLSQLIASFRSDPAPITSLFAAVGARCQLIAEGQRAKLEFNRLNDEINRMGNEVTAERDRAEKLTVTVATLSEQISIRDELVHAQELRIEQLIESTGQNGPESDFESLKALIRRRVVSSKLLAPARPILTSVRELTSRR